MQDSIAILSKMGSKRLYAANQIVFFEGEIPKKLLVLISGGVRIYKTHQHREETLHHIQAPSFIAEMPSFLGLAYPASAVCSCECEILEVPLETFKKQCAQDVEFALAFIASLCHKIAILESHIARTAQSLQERVRHFLLEHRQILPTLSQRQIAQKLNTSPESLSRALRKLKDNGVIAIHKGKIVLL